MWTNKNRAKYKRDHLRYPSDVTDEEWAHVEPLIPPARRGGRRRETNMREALNGVMYVLSTDANSGIFPRICRRAALSIVTSGTGALMECWIASMTRSKKSVASRPTRGQPNRRHHRQPEREKRGKRGASIDPHGFDAGKKIKGKKRHFSSTPKGC